MPEHTNLRNGCRKGFRARMMRLNNIPIRQEQETLNGFGLRLLAWLLRAKQLGYIMSKENDVAECTLTDNERIAILAAVKLLKDDSKEIWLLLDWMGVTTQPAVEDEIP